MSEEWRNRYQKTYWKPQGIGDSITGVFVEVIQKEISGKECDVPVLELEDSIKKELPSHSSLLYKLAEIDHGKTIEVTYTGNIINKFKKEVHQYEIKIVE